MIIRPMYAGQGVKALQPNVLARLPSPETWGHRKEIPSGSKMGCPKQNLQAKPSNQKGQWLTRSQPRTDASGTDFWPPRPVRCGKPRWADAGELLSSRAVEESYRPHPRSPQKKEGQMGKSLKNEIKMAQNPRPVWIFVSKQITPHGLKMPGWCVSFLTCIGIKILPGVNQVLPSTFFL